MSYSTNTFRGMKMKIKKILHFLDENEEFLLEEIIDYSKSVSKLHLHNYSPHLENLSYVGWVENESSEYWNC